MTRPLLLDALILLILAILGVVGYKLAPLLNPKTDLTLPLAACDLGRQACLVDLPDGGKVEFAIEPRPIPALKPLRLQANVTGLEARKVEVDFAGVDMKMGYNRPALTATGNGRYSGQATLPVCITGTMEWDATLLIETAKAVIAVPFRFGANSQ